MLRIAELLIHTDDVPVAARTALASALTGPDDQRCDNLFAAALILERDTGLDSADARELVGLDMCGCDSAALQ